MSSEDEKLFDAIVDGEITSIDDVDNEPSTEPDQQDAVQ